MNPLSIGIISCLICSLLLRTVFFLPPLRTFPEGKILQIHSVLSSTPRTRGALQSFMLQPKGYEAVSITTGAIPRLYYGQQLEVTGSIKSKMIADKKIVKSMYFPKITIKKKQGISYSIRRKITQNFEAALPLDSARLLLGIVFGIKEPLSRTFEEQIRSVGLLHVIAASGMNVTLLAAGLLALLGQFLSRRVAICLSLMGIASYAVLAGLEPSIVRASIMGSLALVAGLLGKQYFGLWALGLTGYFMLMLDPRMIGDVGFQLSFLATLGIISLKPLLTLRFPKTLRLFEEDLLTTSSAQLMTLPILLATFGQYNAISVIVNALILWTIPPLMILGGIAAIVGLLAPPFAQPFLYFCLPLLLLFQTLTGFFAQFSLTVTVKTFPILYLILYYVLIVLLIAFLQRKTKDE